MYKVFLIEKLLPAKGMASPCSPLNNSLYLQITCRKHSNRYEYAFLKHHEGKGHYFIWKLGSSTLETKYFHIKWYDLTESLKNALKAQLLNERLLPPRAVLCSNL